MIARYGIKLFVLFTAGLLVLLVQSSSANEWQRRDRDRDRDRGFGIGTGIGIGIDIGTGLMQQQQQEAPRPALRRQRNLEVTKCYPDFGEVKNVVRCRSRGPSTGAACIAPNSCILYVDKVNTGSSGPVTVAQERDKYVCKCE